MTDAPFAPEAPASQPWSSFNILVVSPTPTHPQDHGNRKRIFEICSELKAQGARIHFIHYPGEHDWRHDWPVKHENAMRTEWASYHLVPPSRPLHEGAVGEDHMIDEWADPSLEHFISWAFRVRHYDMVIVNYTWMSFCFNAVPDHVFKVCDTHDVFGGRRQLLTDNGIDAEFFHTTPEQEKIGLSRADLVWAIKPSEQVYFEKELQLANCLTMLHSDPERGWWAAPPSQDGWLRAGVIGARNNINRRNLEAFLSEALPVLENYMAPVKIVIAGGCSADFEHVSHPNVEVLGRVATVEGFYRGVDVVIAPMQFSTGLKIKVSEALSSGAPLIAHAHAMEGYPTREPLHLLDSFKAMGVALAKLSFDRSKLPHLAYASRKVCAAIRASVVDSLEATRQHMRAQLAGAICVVVPMRAFDPASLLHDHLLAALDYLRFTAPLAVFVTGTPPKSFKLDALERYEVKGQVFIDPLLAAQLGERAPDGWMAVNLAELLEVRGYQRAYLMTDCRAQLPQAKCGLRQAFVRHDAIALGGGDADALIDSLRDRADVVVIGANPTPVDRWAGQTGISNVTHAPFRRTGAFECFSARKPGKKRTRSDILILARAGDLLARHLLLLCDKLNLEATLLDPDDPATAALLMGGSGQTDDFLSDIWSLGLLIDLTSRGDLANVIGEAALRAGIPSLWLQRGTQALALRPFPTALRPTSAGGLFRTLAAYAADPDMRAALKDQTAHLAAARFNADAGWTILWRLLTQQDSSPRSEDAAAQLWG